MRKVLSVWDEAIVKGTYSQIVGPNDVIRVDVASMTDMVAELNDNLCELITEEVFDVIEIDE